MCLIDEKFTRHPFYGSRRMMKYLRDLGHEINRKQIQNLYQEMGLETIYPKKNLSKRNLENKVFPYLLKDLVIDRIDQVWSTDITYSAPRFWNHMKWSPKQEQSWNASYFQ